jgi:DNA-binding transcriptional LysR family regulator
MHKLDWNDLQIILALSKSGSIVSAADELRVDRTTVLRRLGSIEKQLGDRIFDRANGQYKIRIDARELLRASMTVQTIFDEFSRKISGRNIGLTGHIRFTTTDILMDSLVSKYVQGFNDLYPAITLDFLVSTRKLSLKKHEVDVALRAALAPPDYLFGKKICDLHFGIYGQKKHHGDTDISQITQHMWNTLSSFLSMSVPAKWVADHIPKEQINLRADNFHTLQQLTENSQALTLLPCLIGDASHKLVRLDKPLKRSVKKIPLWILTHQDLSTSKPVREFMKYLATCILNDKTALAGVNES